MSKNKPGKLDDRNFVGGQNVHLIGIAMKEMIRRVLTEVRRKHFEVEVYFKGGKDGVARSVFTDADVSAQGIYTKMIREEYPGVGIIAEEESLVEPCTNGSGLHARWKTRMWYR